MTRKAKESVYVVDFDLSAVRSIYLGAHFDAIHLSEIVELISTGTPPTPKIRKVHIDA